MALARHLASATVLFGALTLSAQGASARQSAADTRQLDAVNRSFSPVPLDAQDPPPGLREIREGDCAQTTGCGWIDRNHVRHFFGDTVVKTVRARDMIGRPIRALGIGTARSERLVVANVRRAFPRLHLDCQIDAGDPSQRTCAAEVAPSGPGAGPLIVIEFTLDHRLKDVILYSDQD